jgi:RES domain-containing protein
MEGDALTALQEYNQGVAFHPVTLVRYAVTGGSLVDLTAAGVPAHHSLPPDINSRPWKDAVARGLAPEQWRIAEDLIALGHHGLIYPSQQNSLGRALCLWRWNQPGAPNLVVEDPDRRLPIDASSWRSA